MRFLCFSDIIVVYVPILKKRSGLVMPPGVAAHPQFPTRPHRYLQGRAVGHALETWAESMKTTCPAGQIMLYLILDYSGS